VKIDSVVAITRDKCKVNSLIYEFTLLRRKPSRTAWKRRKILRIHIKFYGVFRTAARTSEIDFDATGRTPTVRSLISQLVACNEYADLKRLLMETGTEDPRPNALIMVSGREISSLDGLETSLSENEELGLLPVAHGG
jgi:molybdopterin converting factor small subunit